MEKVIEHNSASNFVLLLHYRERENRMEYVYEFDNLNRQLELLREANHKLQDTNDGLREIVDVSSMKTPRTPLLGGARRTSSTRTGGGRDGRGGEGGGANGMYFDAELENVKRRRNVRMLPHRRVAGGGGGGGTGSNSPSEYGGGYDSDSMRSRESRGSRARVTDLHFGIKRLLDDLGNLSFIRAILSLCKSSKGHSQGYLRVPFRQRQLYDAW